ncbi:MAG: hypothetical protein VZR95_06165 [Alphaproteobacteria bacterium]
MNKFLFYVGLIALLCLGLHSCNDPVNPKVIGSAPLQYDSPSQIYYVEMDNTSYLVDRIIKDKVYSDEAERYVGMTITIFRVSGNNTIQFIAGQKNASEIEEAFTQNIGALWLCIAIIALFIGLLSWPYRKEMSSRAKTPKQSEQYNNN